MRSFVVIFAHVVWEIYIMIAWAISQLSVGSDELAPNLFHIFDSRISFHTTV